MKCNVYIRIGEESILIAEGLDSSLTPSQIDLSVLDLIKSSNQIDLLEQKLEEVLLDGVSQRLIEGTDKDEFGKRIIANTTAKELALACPGISFPKTNLSKIKVKLVDKIKDSRSNVIVKLSANGEPIYLLDGNPATIRKFARHLSIENAINNEVLDKLDENSEEIKIIDKVLAKAKEKYKKSVTDRKSLLKHYIKNKSKYSDIHILMGEDVYTASVLLDLILPKIENIYYPRNNEYSTPLMKNLHGQGGITYSDGKARISYNSLYNILSGSLNLSMFKSAKEFNSEMKSNEKTEKVLKFFLLFKDLENVELNTDDNYDIMFQLIFSLERGYPQSYSYVNKDGIIIFKSNYYQAKDNYGLSYDTILLLEKKKYKGWTISEHVLDDEKSEFFISLYELQPTTYGKPYPSRREAKAAIDLKIALQSFKSSFFIELYQNFNKMNTFGIIDISSKADTLLKGNVIKIPRITLPNNISVLNPIENIFQGNSTIDNFKNVIRTWPKESLNILLDNTGELIKEVNNVSKAGLFLALLNDTYQNLTRTPEIINDILEKIREANKKPVYLYVESSELKRTPRRDKVTEEIIKDRDGNIVYNEVKEVRLIKLSENPELVSDADKKTKGQQYPIISFWEETAQTLNNLFGTKINVLTQSEIEDIFPNLNYSNEKAFIIGDEVYINSTLGSTEDLFHEYIHIIMGYLKVNNPEVYSKLLLDVWKYTNETDRKNVRRSYGRDGYISMLEENFAKQFAKYIYKRGQGKLDEIFNSDLLEEAFETIFDKSEFNLREVGTHPLSEIFTKFSSEISMALQKNDKLFGTFASSEEFRLNNKKTNLLRKWIKDGKIKEYNCR